MPKTRGQGRKKTVLLSGSSSFAVSTARIRKSRQTASNATTNNVGSSQQSSRANTYHRMCARATLAGTCAFKVNTPTLSGRRCAHVDAYILHTPREPPVRTIGQSERLAGIAGVAGRLGRRIPEPAHSRT